MIEALAELGVEYDGDQPDRAVHLGRLPRADPARDARSAATIDAILDQYRTKKAAGPKQQQKPVDEAELAAAEGSGAAAEDDGSVGAPGTSRTSRTARECGKDLTTVTVVRRRDHRADLHLRLRPRRDRAAAASSTAASWSGRSTGRCAGPTRAWSSSRPASTTPRPARRSSVGGQIVARGLRRRAADRADVRVRRHHRHGEDVAAPRAACRPRPTRWRSWRRRCCAGCTPAAGPTSPSRSPSTRRSSGSTTSGTRSPARSPTAPRCPADVAAYARAVGTAAGELPSDARARCRTARWPPSPTSPPATEEQTLRILRELDPADPLDLAGRGPAPARPGRALGRHPGARPTSAPTCATSPDAELLAVARRAASAAVAAAAASTGSTSTGRWTA